MQYVHYVHYVVFLKFCRRDVVVVVEILYVKNVKTRFYEK